MDIPSTEFIPADEATETDWWETVEPLNSSVLPIGETLEALEAGDEVYVALRTPDGDGYLLSRYEITEAAYPLFTGGPVAFSHEDGEELMLLSQVFCVPAKFEARHILAIGA